MMNSNSGCSGARWRAPGETLERIIPSELAKIGATGRATYELHVERYAFAAKHLRGPTALDIACGVGYGTLSLISRCSELKVAHGVDVSAQAITYARQHYAHEKIRYFCENGICFRGLGAYDSVVSLETIEHVPNPAAFVSHIQNLLRAGGVLIASAPITPSMDGNPHHLTDFTETSFRMLGRNAGLREIDCLVQTQRFDLANVVRGQEQRLERTPLELARFYAVHPPKLVSRLWALLRFGPVNRYLTIAWEKPA